MSKKDRYETFKQMEKVCKNCTKCRLSQSRENVVFGEGKLNSKIMLIGEAPGAQEDKTGRPFVGRAGKLLDRFLEEAGLSREKDIYITNIVKCRPPENRNPKPDEAETCLQYLEAQVKYIQPKIILPAGSVAVKYVLNTKEGITKIRGQWFNLKDNEVKVMPILHPSYLLRQHSENPETPRWHTKQDFKTIKKTLADL